MTKKQPKNPKIIEILNDVLAAELVAINQYFLHGELCGHWGFKRLYKQIRSQSISEMKHAEELVERILFLDGMPNLQRLDKVNVGESVPEMLELDMKLEVEGVARLASGIRTCEDLGDHGSRLLLEEILHSEEEHIDWIDVQQSAIERVGVENYLATQLQD